MKKKMLSLILSAALFCSASVGSSALAVSESTDTLIAPAAFVQWLSVENVSLTFFITSVGNANIVYSVSGKPDSGNMIIKAYIEKRSSAIFWRRVSTGTQNNEWTDRTSKNYYMNSHVVHVTENGDYRATVKVIMPNGDTVTKTAMFTFTKGVMQGDVNFDGRVTASDARLILRCSAGLTTFSLAQKNRGDLNFDGRISSADARLALRIAASLI